MKQMEVKAQREIDGNTFYIRPFPAFTAANISGELSSVIAPLLASLAPFLGAGTSNEKGFMDIDAADAAPAFAKGVEGLSGDKVESLLRKLLTKYKNISVELADGKDTQMLTDDLTNEVFCGNAQDMFILAFEVIKVNFSGFFKKISAPFGEALSGIVTRNLQPTGNTENSTPDNSPT